MFQLKVIDTTRDTYRAAVVDGSSVQMLRDHLEASADRHNMSISPAMPGALFGHVRKDGKVVAKWDIYASPSL